MDIFPQHYLEQALYEKIESDLHNPQEIGQAFCDNILEYWKSIIIPMTGVLCSIILDMACSMRPNNG
jgi:hypothetical protein